MRVITPPPVLQANYDDVCDIDEDDDSIWRQSFWIVTRGQLAQLVSSDKKLKGVKPAEPIPIVGRMYVAYLRMIQKLDKCWNETYQYQKSQAMRRFLDAAINRFTEIKEALAELDMSEFHYIDGQLIELKLIPRDLEIIPLAAYPLRRESQLQELAERLYKGEKIYKDPDEVTDEVVEEHKENKKIKRPVVEKKIDPIWEGIKEAIKLIQNHERARVARLEFLDEKTIFDMRNNYTRPVPVPKETATMCATTIQRLWRGYCVRRELKKRIVRSDELLNFTVPSWRSTELEEKLKEFEDKKRIRREEKAKEYIEACLKEKERVLRVVGPGLMEDIGDEIRWWFRNWYDVAKAFDKYPTEEKGGTIIVVRGETLTPEEYREEQEKKRREKEKLKNNPALAKKMKQEAEKKKKDALEKAKKEKERKKKEKREAKKRAKKGIVEPFSFKESPALDNMKKANKMFDEEWTPRDEEIAKDDQPVMERITDQKCYEVQLEMRKIVDEMMRLELELLEAAHERDRTARRKGKKGKAKKAKKKKKGKKRKGKKAKKDITGHRTIEDLFQELYDKGIIRKYPSVDLNSFIGDYAYKNLELRSLDLDPLPAVSEVKQIVINNCILPLGGQNITKSKSVCICGPRQSGKKLLVHAICTAIGAVLFDLSPEVTAGKYSGKESMKIFLHLINKMARILQPSVILVNGAEKMFYKKVPKLERVFEPKKLKGKFFKQIVKPITLEDRIMVIGTSSQPWICTQKPFLKAYEKFIMIPRTDYGTVYQLWMDILMKYHSISRHIDVSALAQLSIGYPVSYIREVAEKIICPKRLIRFKFEPLRQHELLEGLMMSGQPEPVTKQEQDKFTNWYNKKTKLGKTRTKIVRGLREKRLAEEAMQTKKKK